MSYKSEKKVNSKVYSSNKATAQRWRRSSTYENKLFAGWVVHGVRQLRGLKGLTLLWEHTYISLLPFFMLIIVLFLQNKGGCVSQNWFFFHSSRLFHILLTELKRTHAQTDHILTDFCHLGNEVKLQVRFLQGGRNI